MNDRTDDSSASSSDDAKLDARAKELMENDEEVQALHQRRGFSPAFQLALEKACTQLGITP